MNYVFVEGVIKKIFQLKSGKELIYVKFFVEVEIPDKQVNVIEIKLIGGLMQCTRNYDIGYRVQVKGHFTSLLKDKVKGNFIQYIEADVICPI